MPPRLPLCHTRVIAWTPRGAAFHHLVKAFCFFSLTAKTLSNEETGVDEAPGESPQNYSSSLSSCPPPSPHPPCMSPRGHSRADGDKLLRVPRKHESLTGGGVRSRNTCICLSGSRKMTGGAPVKQTHLPVPTVPTASTCEGNKRARERHPPLQIGLEALVLT